MEIQAHGALIEVLGDRWWKAREDALFALRLVSGEDFGRQPEAWSAWLQASDDL